MKRARLSMITVALSGLLVAGCATTHAHKGAVLPADLVSAIQPGVDNKASVEKVLGRPTFVAEFTPNEWYYVSRDTNQLAFRNPRVDRQTVLHISFDAEGNVISTNQTGKELALELNPSGRSTPTLGHKKSFFDELFGNIGQVGSGGLGGQTGPGGY